jgi:DHA2 family multidrug resistance protein-like MFS transporter
MMDLAMGAAPAERAGTASSLMETGAEFGGALGMAVLGSIGTAVYRHRIPASAPSPAHETLGGALAAAHSMPGRAGAELLATAREAFTSGMQSAAITGAVLLLAAAALATATLRGIRVRDAQE